MASFYSCFQSPEFLKDHIFSIMEFYYPRCIDHINEGYYNCYLDDGTICDYETKHLVGTTRFIYNFSIASILDKNARWSREALVYGLEFLQTFHLDKKNGGYYWILEGITPTDTTKFAYGHAFVLLAASKAYQAGIAAAADIIEYAYDILEKHFWQPKYNLYLDQISEDWSKIYPYRGQNSNMHLCDAMISAYEATGNEKYLERAYTLAKSVTLGLASQADGLIWENYHIDWTVDWDYEEKDETLAQFRPRGFVPGHLVEWSKILLILDRHMHKNWLVKKAQFLFEYAILHGMDPKYGGIFYLLSREGKVIDTDKRYWVMSEAIGASALLACKTSQKYYWYIYDTIFYYCWNYFVDHEYGGWYNILDRQNVRYSNVKSPVTKTDYHPITNCYEVLREILT
jgi:mannose/cellobiose epimerase-like protein (N-acyl-D-glucosamine 2-epimerase family)